MNENHDQILFARLILAIGASFFVTTSSCGNPRVGNVNQPPQCHYDCFNREYFALEPECYLNKSLVITFFDLMQIL
jgi:hypothetical protein